MYEVRSELQCNFAIHNTYTEYFLNRNQKGDFKMTKKIMSMILSIAMVLSIAVVGISGVSAAVDSDGRYVPSEGVETHRIYFAMPNSWKSAKYGADSAGIFWWNGSDTDGFVEGTERLAWPGYKMQVADAESNLYYVDLPTDVIAVIFNNALNGGERIVDDYGNVTYEFSEGQFMAANQTADIISGSYSEGDDDYYDNMLDGEFWSKAKAALNGDDKSFLGNFADNFYEDPDWGIAMNFDNMVYIVDLNNAAENLVSGKKFYYGEYYFFYGKNEKTGKYEYGGLPNYEMAKENGVLYELNDTSTPDEPSSEPTTTPEPTTPEPAVKEIKFDVKKSGWENVKNIYCHVWAADGTGVWPMWQTRSEKCVYDPDTGIAAYDLSKTGNTISASDGKRYCVIFSANTGVQTYNVVMDGKCIGDTLYCTGNKLENPDDSEKVALEAVWTENKDCGPEKRITTTGNVIGTTLTEGVTDETLPAQYLIDYYDFPEKSAYTQNLLNALLVSPKDVKTAAESILDSSDYLDKDTILSKVEEILAECSDPLESMIYGDVNNDGIITIVDATIVQKYIVNMAHLDNVNQKLADVDVDAVITIKDATAVQKYIVNVDGYGKTGEKFAAA